MGKLAFLGKARAMHEHGNMHLAVAGAIFLFLVITAAAVIGADFGYRRGQRAAHPCPDIEVQACGVECRGCEIGSLAIQYSVADFDPLVICRCGIEGHTPTVEVTMGGLR